MTWPTTLTINAWTGESASGAVSLQATDWAVNAPQPGVTESLGPPPGADPADWRDPSIGWGLSCPIAPDYPLLTWFPRSMRQNRYAHWCRRATMRASCATCPTRPIA